MKRKKNIYILTDFSISHKNSIKTFLKFIINNCSRTPINMTLFYKFIFGKPPNNLFFPWNLVSGSMLPRLSILNMTHDLIWNFNLIMLNVYQISYL